jgi:5'-phosphate synthase pdxT subunit
MSLTVGVLSIQGDVQENLVSVKAAINELGIDGKVIDVRKPEEISQLDGLIIPGGESTTIGQLSLVNGSLKEIKQKVESGMPVLGICAGMVLLANNASDKVVGKIEQPLFNFLDIDLERNSFGRQRESFEANISMDSIGISNFNGVFIRAPTITTTSNDIEVLAKLDGKIIAIKKGNIIGTSFHPELTRDLSIHKYFVNLVKDTKN